MNGTVGLGDLIVWCGAVAGVILLGRLVVYLFKRRRGS